MVVNWRLSLAYVGFGGCEAGNSRPSNASPEAPGAHFGDEGSASAEAASQQGSTVITKSNGLFERTLTALFGAPA